MKRSRAHASEDLSMRSPLCQPCGASYWQQHAAHAVNSDPEHFARLLGPHGERSRHISDANQRLQLDWLQIRKTSKTHLLFVSPSPPTTTTVLPLPAATCCGTTTRFPLIFTSSPSPPHISLFCSVRYLLAQTTSMPFSFIELIFSLALTLY